jgi:hypothetical protein
MNKLSFKIPTTSSKVQLWIILEMTSKRINLNNRIARKQKELELVEEQRSKLQTQFEEVNDNKVNKIRKASNIIMVYIYKELY